VKQSCIGWLLKFVEKIPTPRSDYVSSAHSGSFEQDTVVFLHVQFVTSIPTKPGNIYKDHSSIEHHLRRSREENRNRCNASRPAKV
jgi:hypothetical protein